jgi:uncharacterized protein YuzE
MKIEYDREADALYIQLREAHVHDNIDIEEGISVDIDENRHVIGIEILDVTHRIPVEELTKLTFERFPMELPSVARSK